MIKWAFIGVAALSAGIGGYVGYKIGQKVCTVKSLLPDWLSPSSGNVEPTGVNPSGVSGGNFA